MFVVHRTRRVSLSTPLFCREDGKTWNKDSWKGPIKEAAAAAELSPAVTAYTIRHSVITDLVTGGLDLLTVAQLSGTSVAMIERHYGHLRADHAAAALARLTL
jgi:site-specific recombinase XerD